MQPHQSATNGLQAHDEQLPGAHAADRQTPDRVRSQEQAGVAARRLGESERPRQPVPQMDAPDTKQVRGAAGASRGDHLTVCPMSPADRLTGGTHVIFLGLDCHERLHHTALTQPWSPGPSASQVSQISWAH